MASISTVLKSIGKKINQEFDFGTVLVWDADKGTYTESNVTDEFITPSKNAVKSFLDKRSARKEEGKANLIVLPVEKHRIFDAPSNAEIAGWGIDTLQPRSAKKVSELKPFNPTSTYHARLLDKAVEKTPFTEGTQGLISKMAEVGIELSAAQAFNVVAHQVEQKFELEQ